jgi:hypothetical protein
MLKDNVHIYKGKGLKLMKTETKNVKTFVFDLDETIGHFSEIYILFQFIEHIQSTLFENDKQCLFFLLDLFPEVFRYGIEIIFQYLHKKKEKNKTMVYIYTNNSCIPITWTTYISEYIEEKWKVDNLFNNIVRAFKINGKVVEHKRTTGEKTYEEFLHCVQLPKKTELCFLDNSEHSLMKHRYVYYLQPKPYYIGLSRNEITQRFINAMKEKCENNIQEQLHNYYKTHELVINDNKKTYQDSIVDMKISKKLLQCIQKFYKYKIVKIYTRKKRSSIKNKTQKKKS